MMLTTAPLVRGEKALIPGCDVVHTSPNPAGSSPPAMSGIACASCRHPGAGFEPLDPAETRVLARFKLGHGFAAAGADIEVPLFTLYSGWALRFRLLPGGARRPIGVVLPGDLVGLEIFAGPAALGTRALTDVTYCRFDPARGHELLAVPSLAERLCRLQAIALRDAQERMVAANSLPATGNLCHFILTLFEALRGRRLVRDDGFRLPLARRDLADLHRWILHRIRRDLEDVDPMLLPQPVFMADEDAMSGNAHAAPVAHRIEVAARPAPGRRILRGGDGEYPMQGRDVAEQMQTLLQERRTGPGIGLGGLCVDAAVPADPAGGHLCGRSLEG